MTGTVVVYDETKNKLLFSSKSGVLLPIYFFFLCIGYSLLVGCSTTQPPVPVVDRAQTTTSMRANPVDSDKLGHQVYTVQKGDTLYAIAINHGVDYKKLVEWNNISDPNSIRPGQKINLSIPEKESKPTLYALPQQPITTTIEPNGQIPEPLSAVPQEGTSPAANSDKIKTSPKALKVPFSEQNVARLQQSPTTQGAIGASAVLATSSNEKLSEIKPASQLESPASEKMANRSQGDWIWPTTGKVLSFFSKSSKGVKISGQTGQPIVASAAGVVVYSGSGLRGYGNLIIIKHDEIYLSAYAHNSKLLVKEGETVAKGQKIAEMGDTDSDTTQLHFEIRKNSKPVDPLEYLPHQS